MSEPFIAQIVMFGGNFAPRGWALCEGQLLAISQNTALFSLLGTTYGGDGRTTFGLPDLRGRVPIGAGQGPGLSRYLLGQKGGSESVTLNLTQIPSHTHELRCNTGEPDDTNPTARFLANSAGTGGDLYSDSSNASMGALGNSGGGQAHTNIQPFTCVNFIIALVGIFPSRS